MYAELHAHSHFSLLDGASSPEALVEEAARLGLSALALTDHDALYGAVRFWRAARDAGLHPVIGAEVTLEGESHLTLLAETQAGYANLCRLLSWGRVASDEGRVASEDKTAGRSALPSSSRYSSLATRYSPPWPGKSAPRLPWDALRAHCHGLIALSGCRRGPVAAPLLRGDTETASLAAARLREVFGPDHLFVELQRHLLPDEPSLIRSLVDLARRLDLPLVATNNVHYATRAEHRLQDVLVAIHHLTTLDDAHARGLLRSNSETCLKSPTEMARLFKAFPDALANTLRIAERCQVSLDFSGQRLPAFPVPDGHTPFSFLYDLCQQGLHRKVQPVTPDASRQLARELDVIEKTGLAGYFLVVWDIVRFAQRQRIRYQGRGSAANSLVAYLLDITPVDPLRFNLLFERFLSDDRHTMPDIDIDFAADRREEVIQYVYDRYGAEHTAMVCNVVTFRDRSARRDMERVVSGQWLSVVRGVTRRPEGDRAQGTEDRHEGEAGSEEEDSAQHGAGGEQQRHAAPSSPRYSSLATRHFLEGLPRHLSIHSGGMLITAAPLVEVVPVERATMPGRVVVQWDKDSVEDAGLIKLDLLGLRMLGLVDEAARLIAARTGTPPPLDRLPLDDLRIYDLLCAGDTIGAFQVESRAQISMLPRLKPRCFDDIVVAVSIVRPGPIQGGMVHPYLRRRAGLEPVTYPHPSLEPVLRETLGVILFQEQVLRVAMVAAGFSGGEADHLRRAMSRDRGPGEMARLRARFVQGAAVNGLAEATAHTVFDQLAAFAAYGFCKSHAAAFAHLAYQSLWLKLYHPAEFTCALLNHQPMGFYSPSVIMGDAQRHGVVIRHPDVNRSAETCRIEGEAVRLGLRYLHGFGPTAHARLLAARSEQPFVNLVDLCHRTRLPRALVETLIRSGALDEMSGGEGQRRTLMWDLGALDYREEALDLVAPVEPASLPDLTEREALAWEVELLGMAPGDHPMRLYRQELTTAGVLTCEDLTHRRDGEVARVAGEAVVRQRPPTAKGHVFFTLEDETGLVNLILRPDVYERRRETWDQALLVVRGRLQREGAALSLLALDVEALADVTGP
ncbi:MAG: error-prone DNA polymerase [Anaerolineae bacterium]|nr:error-prone DNA polymerase [Anaerolineae bacterium]